MKRRTNGSAHVVIIVVLIVALLGALGYIFYQNFIAKKADTESPSVTTSTENSKDSTVKTAHLAMTDVFKNGVSLDYPESWSFIHEAAQGDIPATDKTTTMDNYSFISPDKKVTLSIQQMAGGGIGGACMPEEEPTLATYGYETSSLWPGHTYVEFTYKDSSSGKITVRQSITHQATATSAKAGDSVCDSRYYNIAETGKYVETESPILLMTNIRAENSTENGLYEDSAASAKAYLESQNAKDIKSILLSIH